MFAYSQMHSNIGYNLATKLRVGCMQTVDLYEIESLSGLRNISGVTVICVSPGNACRWTDIPSATCSPNRNTRGFPHGRTCGICVSQATCFALRPIDSKRWTHVNVHMQNGASDCGLFAIAFAVWRERTTCVLLRPESDAPPPVPMPGERNNDGVSCHEEA